MIALDSLFLVSDLFIYPSCQLWKVNEGIAVALCSFNYIVSILFNVRHRVFIVPLKEKVNTPCRNIFIQR